MRGLLLLLRFRLRLLLRLLLLLLLLLFLLCCMSSDLISISRTYCQLNCLRRVTRRKRFRDTTKTYYDNTSASRLVIVICYIANRTVVSNTSINVRLMCLTGIWLRRKNTLRSSKVQRESSATDVVNIGIRVSHFHEGSEFWVSWRKCHARS